MGLSLKSAEQCGGNYDVQCSREVVQELSRCKGSEVFERTSGDVLVIGADTVVAFQDSILGKPADAAMAGICFYVSRAIPIRYTQA